MCVGPLDTCLFLILTLPLFGVTAPRSRGPGQGMVVRPLEITYYFWSDTSGRRKSGRAVGAVDLVYITTLMCTDALWAISPPL